VKRLDDLCERAKFNGSLLVKHNQNVIYRKGFGYACYEFDIKNSPQTSMRIASISKQFTACAILQLVEQGKLSILDSIQRFFPNYPNAENITIHQLLSNTSGIPNFDLNADFYGAFQHENYYEGLIRMFRDLPPSFPPGSAYEYSNSGYLLLSYIVEKITQKSFSEYLKDSFFKPLGMASSGFDYVHEVIKGKAHPYDMKDGNVIKAKHMDMRIASGGGAICSSVDDLSKWNDALLGNKLLSKENTDRIFSPHIKISEDTSYGYGMFLTTETILGKPYVRWYHTGGGPGVRSINDVYPEVGIEIIFLSNVNDRVAYNMVLQEVNDIVFDVIVKQSE